MLLHIILSSLALLILIPFVVGGILFAPWVPSRRRDLERIYGLARVQTRETFIELGCGTGLVLLYGARHYDARFVGVEMFAPVLLVAYLRRIFLPRKERVRLRLGNLYHTDVSDADIIYLFGLPDQMAHRLRTKLERELKKGARVVSYSFAIEGWTPVEVSRPCPERDLPIYLYER